VGCRRFAVRLSFFAGGNVSSESSVLITCRKDLECSTIVYKPVRRRAQIRMKDITHNLACVRFGSVVLVEGQGRDVKTYEYASTLSAECKKCLLP
jgi:hypothetical protein